MIVTTTPEISGRQIREYLGIVTGEAIMGANVFRDMFAGLRDIVGGRSAAYEKELRRAREIHAGTQDSARDWAPMRLSVWIWITKYSVSRTAC